MSGRAPQLRPYALVHTHVFVRTDVFVHTDEGAARLRP